MLIITAAGWRPLGSDGLHTRGGGHRKLFTRLGGVVRLRRMETVSVVTVSMCDAAAFRRSPTPHHPTDRARPPDRQVAISWGSPRPGTVTLFLQEENEQPHPRDGKRRR